MLFCYTACMNQPFCGVVHEIAVDYPLKGMNTAHRSAPRWPIAFSYTNTTHDTWLSHRSQNEQISNVNDKSSRTSTADIYDLQQEKTHETKNDDRISFVSCAACMDYGD